MRHSPSIRFKKYRVYQCKQTVFRLLGWPILQVDSASSIGKEFSAEPLDRNDLIIL